MNGDNQYNDSSSDELEEEPTQREPIAKRSRLESEQSGGMLTGDSTGSCPITVPNNEVNHPDGCPEDDDDDVFFFNNQLGDLDLVEQHLNAMDNPPSGAYTDVRHMRMAMDKFIKEHSSQPKSTNYRTVHLMDAISKTQVPIHIVEPLSIAHLQDFCVTGHAFSISHVHNYIVPLGFDFDCMQCKLGVCSRKSPLEADNPWFENICSILSKKFKLTIDNEAGPITYQIFVRDGTCSFHMYFSISVGLFLHQCLYSILNQEMPVNFLGRYIIDRVVHMPMPFSAKRDFEVYKPLLSQELNKNIWVVPCAPFLDVPLRFTHSTEIVGKTVLLLKNFLFSEQELSFIRNTNFNATNAVSSRVIMMDGEDVKTLRSVPQLFSQLREKSFVVESFGNPVAEQFFKEFVSRVQPQLTSQESIGIDYYVQLLSNLCQEEPNLMYTLTNFFNLMTLLAKLYYPINLLNTIKIPDTDIIIPVNIIMMIRHWFTFDSQHYLILQIISTVQRLLLVELELSARTVSEFVLQILKCILNFEELTSVGKYILENMNNTTWETNCGGELLNFANSDLIFYIGHRAANDFVNQQNETNIPVTEELIFSFIRNHYELNDIRSLQKPLLYYFTIQEPIIAVSDRQYMIYNNYEGLYKPAAEKALVIHIGNLTKRLLTYASINDKIQNEVLESMAKAVLRAMPSREFNQYNQMLNCSIGLYFCSLGVYQKHVPSAYWSMQRTFFTRHVDLSLTDNLLEHSNLYFVAQRKMLKNTFESMLNNANRFLFLETFIPSILHLPFHAYDQPTILMACFSKFFQRKQYRLLDFLPIFIYFKIRTSVLKHVLVVCDKIQISPTAYGDIVRTLRLKPIKDRINISGEFFLDSLQDVAMLSDKVSRLGTTEERLIYFYCSLIIDRFSSKPCSRSISRTLLLDNTVLLETLDPQSIINSLPDGSQFTYTKRTLNIIGQHHQTCEMGCIALAEIMNEKLEVLNSATIQFIRNTLVSLDFSAKEFRDLMHDLTGLCQPGCNRKKVIALHGKSGSGKSYLTSLLALACGKSHFSLNSSFSSKDGASGANPQLISMSQAAVINIAEMQYLDDSLLKAITGGDIIHRRGLNSNHSQSLSFVGFFTSTSNVLPQTKVDAALVNRFEFYYFRNKFVEESNLTTINRFVHLAKHEQVIKNKNKLRDAVTAHNLIATVFTFHVQSNGEFKPNILNYQGYTLKFMLRAINCEKYALIQKKGLHILPGLEIPRTDFHAMFAGEKESLVEGIEKILLTRDNCLVPGVYQNFGLISEEELEHLFNQLPMFLLVPDSSDLMQDKLTELIYRVGVFHSSVTILHQINLFKNHPSFDGDRLRYVKHKVTSKLQYYECELPDPQLGLTEIRQYIAKRFQENNLEFNSLVVDGEIILLINLGYFDESVLDRH